PQNHVQCGAAITRIRTGPKTKGAHVDGTVRPRGGAVDAAISVAQWDKIPDRSAAQFADGCEKRSANLCGAPETANGDTDRICGSRGGEQRCPRRHRQSCQKPEFRAHCSTPTASRHGQVPSVNSKWMPLGPATHKILDKIGTPPVQYQDATICMINEIIRLDRIRMPERLKVSRK